jgi:hypothetical protein
MCEHRSDREEHPTQPTDDTIHAVATDVLQRLAAQLAGGQISASEGIARLALANAGGKQVESRNETSLRPLLRQWIRLLAEAEQNGILIPESEEEVQEAAQRHRIWAEECTRQEERDEAREEELLSFFYTEMADEWGAEVITDIEREPPEWKVAWERYKATGVSGLVGPVESQSLSQAADLKRAAQQGVIDLVRGRRGTAEVIAWKELLASLAPSRTEDEEVPLAERFATVRQKLRVAIDEERDRLAPQMARWELAMAAIERHRHRVEQGDPDREQLSGWQQQLLQELLRTGILEEIQRCETAES